MNRFLQLSHVGPALPPSSPLPSPPGGPQQPQLVPAHRGPVKSPEKAPKAALVCGQQTLTDGRAVEEKSNTDEDPHTQHKDEGPPAAPAQGTAVACRANKRCEDEAEDGAQEPGEAVVLLREACRDTRPVTHHSCTPT